MLALEQQKLSSLRDAMMAPDELDAPTGAGGADDELLIDWRKLEMSDFIGAEIPSNLGEHFLKLGEQLKASLAEAERDGGQAQAMLRDGAAMLQSLTTAGAMASRQASTGAPAAVAAAPATAAAPALAPAATRAPAAAAAK